LENNHPTPGNAKQPVSIQPNIGLDGEARKSVMEILNTILADEALLTMKTHGAFWLVHGPGFLELRTLFSQQLVQLNIISDETADRIRMIGGFAISTFEEFLK
jgi:starvation-inducible DNA-binding protein